MLPIHTILHPTDFSEPSEYALRFAAGLARDYGARLVVLHAAGATPLSYFEGASAGDPEAPIRAARQRFEQLDVPHLGASIERRFEVGGATETILQTAADVRADLIVMGTHGRTGLERFLMGKRGRAGRPPRPLSGADHDRAIRGGGGAGRGSGRGGLLRVRRDSTTDHE